MTSLQVTKDDAASGEATNSLRLFVDGEISAGKLVSSRCVRQPNSTEVKSLIWEYDGCPMVIVLDEAKQVNVSLVAQFCGVPVQAVSLVSRERAVQLAGIALAASPEYIANAIADSCLSTSKRRRRLWSDAYSLLSKFPFAAYICSYQSHELQPDKSITLS